MTIRGRNNLDELTEAMMEEKDAARLAWDVGIRMESLSPFIYELSLRLHFCESASVLKMYVLL